MLNKILNIALLIPTLLMTSAFADERLTGRRLAVVVGIDKYRVSGGLGDLAHAEADAVSVSDALRNAGFTVIEMTHKAAREPGNEHFAPNRTYIRDMIGSILETPNLGRKDTVLISLHGHGVHYDEITSDNEKVPRFYFCPADASITGLETANDVVDRNYLISTDELYQSLGSCKAATRLLIVDACRNDPNRTEEFRSAPLASKTMPKLPPPPGGIVAFFSCKANQMAIEDKDLGHGVFSHFLVQGLSGRADQPLEGSPADGIITMSELTSYVANHTYSFVFDKYNGRRKQSPDIRGEFDTNLPLVNLQAIENRTALERLKELADEQNMVATGSSRQAAFFDATKHARVGSRLDLCDDIKLVGVWCPPGSFEMGDPVDRSDVLASLIVNQAKTVNLTQGFWMGQTEITQAQWHSVMGTRPWLADGNSATTQEGADLPATFVSHGRNANGTTETDSATAFCMALTEQQQKKYRLPTDWEFRLPTEAQSEYACRAGTKTDYCFGKMESGLDDYGWYRNNTQSVGEAFPHSVAKKKQNDWGLFDCHGNVHEWCEDSFTDAISGGPDPFVKVGSERVYRGGSWSGSAHDCRSGGRSGAQPALRSNEIGFRVVLAPKK